MQDGESAVHLAVRHKHIPVVVMLVEGGVDKQRDGNTALHLTAQFGLADMARQLMSLGADLDILNLIGVTPAELARQYGNHDLSDELKLDES